MKLVGPLVLLFSMSMLWSCQKCKDCTLTRTQEVEGAGTQTTTTLREYCGSTLDDIEGNSEYSKNGVDYKWTCE
mgnify:CR=1 FL=1